MATKPIRSKKGSKKKRPQRKPVPIGECIAALRKTNSLTDGEELYSLKNVARCLAQLRGVSEQEIDPVMRFLKHYFHESPEGCIHRRWTHFQLTYGLPVSNVDDLLETGIPWEEAVITINSFTDWYAGEVSNTRSKSGRAGGKASVVKKNAEKEEDAAAELEEDAQSGAGKINRPTRVSLTRNAPTKKSSSTPARRNKKPRRDRDGRRGAKNR